MPVLSRSIRLFVLVPLLLAATRLTAQVVTITPTPSSFSSIIPNANYSMTWAVKNADDIQEFTFDVPHGSSPCTLSTYDATFGGGATVNVVATCTSGAPSSAGSFKLSVTSMDSLYVKTGSVSWTTGAARIAFTAPGGTGPSSVTVHTPRPVVRAQFLPLTGDNFDTTTTQVLVGGADVTSLARSNRGLLEFEIDSLHQLTPGYPVAVEIHRCTTSGHCTYATRTLTLANDSTPLVDLTAMPLERTGGGFSGSFGPGLSLSGVEVQTGFSTPAYISVGASRSAGLVYSTRTSYPRALVAVNVTLPWPAGSADQLKTVLYDGGVRKDSLIVPSPNCATGAVHTCQVVLQADYASGVISGGVSRRWLVVEVSVTSGGVTKMSSDSTEVVLVDRRDSPYGTGWWPSVGTMLVGAGIDQILVGPDGSASIFRGLGDTLYLPPAGGAMGLLKVGSTWELHPRGSHAKIVFGANGRLLKSVDASGNRDSVAYDSAGRVVTLFDPLNKTVIYTYSAVTGKLNSLVSLPGTSGRRTTQVTINSSTNLLIYDSLSSPAAHPIVARYSYLTYSGVNGTVQLRARRGRFGSDSVTVLYDSTTGGSNRPLQARLMRPLPSDSVPVIGYKASELQGWHRYRSRDSVYVEVTDPLGHWTRSHVDRWGGGTLSYDQVGLLSRSSYDPVGRILWTEGKVADSSRVYTSYDNLGRVVRTYLLRSGAGMLRLDSLTYDSFDRVSQHIDSRGGVTTYLYDSADRIYSEHAPGGAYTTRSFRSDGQLLSILLPTKTTPDSVQYDASFHNPVAWYSDSGQLVRSAVLDSMGRVMQTDARIRVQQLAVLQWQARRTSIFIDAIGRADSTVVSQSTVCNDPCTNPSGFTTLWTTKPSLDSLGRTTQVQVVGNNASTETFDLDRLGRVIGHGASGGGRDSLVYDLAGNVVKTITRRGDTLTTSYDTRNRPDTSYIPGYGTVHRTYAGPLDQLTRLHVTGFVDSLGGVNPDRAFVFDQRGRLIRDSLWTGGVARQTLYGYDALDRGDSLTDTLGTWVTQFTTTTGLVARHIAPTGDTLSYTYDLAGRETAMNLLRGGSSSLPKSTMTYSSSGELSRLTQTDSSGKDHVYTAMDWLPVNGGAGNNVGLVLQSQNTWSMINSNGTLHQNESVQDTMGYDALRRLKSWGEFSNGQTNPTESYSYDNNGNLTISGTTPTFASGSNRLTVITRTGGAKSVYSYDGAGNLIQRDDSLSGALACSWQYGYNGMGQMVSVRARTGGGSLQLVARYAYDVVGNRIARRVYTNSANCTSAPAGYTRYAVRGGQVQYETDSAGTGILRRYLWGMGADNLIAVQMGSVADSIFYAVTDRVGSVRGWAAKDGSLRGTIRYRPYGTVIDSTGSAVSEPYRWTAREYDPETGLYFLRARYYDPTIGRFNQEDPAGAEGSRNLYAYVEGSPLQATDPSGLQSTPLPNYTFCSITSGACLSSDGTFYGGNPGFNTTDGGGGGGRGFIDSNNDGRDDFQEFAWYAEAGWKFKDNGGTAVEWEYTSMAIDHGGYTAEAESAIRELFMEGKVSVEDVKIRPDGLPDPSVVMQTRPGHITMYRVRNCGIFCQELPGGITYRGAFDNGILAFAWDIAHEYGHYIGFWDERQAGCYASHATGWIGPYAHSLQLDGSPQPQGQCW